MKYLTRKVWLGLFCSVFVSSLQAQVQLSWLQRYHAEPTGFYIIDHDAQGIASDPAGDIVVIASVTGNFYTAKYSGTNGAVLWGKTYAGGDDYDTPIALSLDAVGNAIVTGYTYLTHTAVVGGQTIQVSDYDIYTIKYATANGAVLWVKKDGSSDQTEIGYANAVDAAGNVLVTGTAQDGDANDIYTAKYAAATGALLWSKRTRDVATGSSYGVDIVTDAAGNAIVIGNIWNGSNTDVFVAKYAASNGDIVWQKRFNGAANRNEVGVRVALDAAGNVIIGASSQNAGRRDLYFAKYDGASGTRLWERLEQRYSASSISNYPVADLKVDAAGNVLVAGSLVNPATGEQAYAAKFSGSNGSIIWEKFLPQPTLYLSSLALDAAGNPIIAGYIDQYLDPLTSDYYAAKLASGDGALVWDGGYDGGPGAYDFLLPGGVVATPDGGAVLVGATMRREQNEIATVKLLPQPTPENGMQTIAVVGQPVPGQPPGTVYASLNGPNLSALSVNAFSGKLKTGSGAAVGAIFALDGTVILKEGAAAPGIPGAVIARLGEFSGQAVVATLQSEIGGVTSGNDGVLYVRLGLEGMRVGAREGDVPANAPNVRIKSFGTIDGYGGSTIYFLATLLGPAATNDLALMGIPLDETLLLILQKGGTLHTSAGDVATRSFATLVGVTGTLAEGRWRDADSIGIRATLSNGQQRLYLYPINLDRVWQDRSFQYPQSSLGLPAFGFNTLAVPGLLTVGGEVTKANDSVLLVRDETDQFIMAREGSLAPGPDGSPLAEVRFAKLGEVVAGAFGKAAFNATLNGPGVTAANHQGLWYRSRAGAVRQLARTGSSAPGGGRWSGFTSFAQEDANYFRGPVFTGQLGISAADGVTSLNRDGLWAVDSTDRLRLLLRTGQAISIAGSPKIVKSFRALEGASGTLGASRGYARDGSSVAALVATTDRVTALIKIPVP